MSHTSAQSSHNPAPDLGPEQSADSIIQWMRKVTAKLVDLSARLEALEDRADINTKAVSALSDWLGDIGDRLDRVGKVVELPAHGIIGTEKDLNNWNNEGGKIL